MNNLFSGFVLVKNGLLFNFMWKTTCWTRVAYFPYPHKWGYWWHHFLFYTAVCAKTLLSVYNKKRKSLDIVSPLENTFISLPRTSPKWWKGVEVFNIIKLNILSPLSLHTEQMITNTDLSTKLHVCIGNMCTTLVLDPKLLTLIWGSSYVLAIHAQYWC